MGENECFIQYKLSSQSLHDYFHCTNECFILAFIYLDRVVTLNQFGQLGGASGASILAPGRGGSSASAGRHGNTADLERRTWGLRGTTGPTEGLHPNSVGDGLGHTFPGAGTKSDEQQLVGILAKFGFTVEAPSVGLFRNGYWSGVRGLRGIGPQ